MERKEFSTIINAPRDNLWKILWGAETYPAWTAVFAEGSKAITDWEQGSKVLFLNADNEGMVSMIDCKKENEFMSFKHIGMIDKEGYEDLESEKVKAWTGALETYKLKDHKEGTTLIVEMDLEDEYRDYFLETWPKALDKLKELAEMSVNNKSVNN